MLVVLGSQKAPAPQWNAGDLQIVGVHDVRDRPLHLRRCRWPCVSLQPEGQRAEVAGHRYGIEAEGRLLKTRNGLECLAHLPPHRHHMVWRRDRHRKRDSRDRSRSVLNPGSMRRTVTRLRIISPALTNRTQASAISKTTNTPWARWWAPPARGPRSISPA